MGSTTAWPSALSIAASWDISLMYQWANAMGLEFKQKGANIALAPGIGIARVPNAGRNFEYLCGEDPILGATLVTNVIKGYIYYLSILYILYNHIILIYNKYC